MANSRPAGLSRRSLVSVLAMLPFARPLSSPSEKGAGLPVLTSVIRDWPVDQLLSDSLNTSSVLSSDAVRQLGARLSSQGIDTDNQAQVHAALSEMIVGDFRRGEMVAVDGWRFSPTEVLIAVAAGKPQVSEVSA